MRVLRGVSACALCLAIPSVAQELAVPRGVPTDWDARDLEGRWVAYRAAVEVGDEALQATWYTWLGARREFELLEWMALYEPRQGSQKVSPLTVLHDVDAPHWLRAAVWIGPRHSDSHQRDKAEELLISRNTFTSEPYALAMPRDDEALRLAIDRALSYIYRSGAIYQVFSKHFGKVGPEVVFFYSVMALPE